MKNHVLLIGRLGGDPEKITFADGGQIANCSVATWKNYKDKRTQEWETLTEWHKVVLRGRAAEFLPDVSKGDMVVVEGEIHTRQYTNKEGYERYVTEIVGTLKALPKPKKDSAMSSEPKQPMSDTGQTSFDTDNGDDDLPF